MHCEPNSFSTITALFSQVARFPFEELPACKQGAKQEPCPPTTISTSAPSASGSAAAVGTEAKTGKGFT